VSVYRMFKRLCKKRTIKAELPSHYVKPFGTLPSRATSHSLNDYFYASRNNIEWQYEMEGICNEGRGRDLKEVLSRLFLGRTKTVSQHRPASRSRFKLGTSEYRTGPYHYSKMLGRDSFSCSNSTLYMSWKAELAANRHYVE